MKRKQIFCILLTALTLACTAQEPREMYSVPYHDSVVASKDNIIQSLRLALINQQYSDTAIISLEGLTDSTLTTINKSGENITVTIQNGNKRITSMFSEGERKAFFINDSDTSKTVGSFQLDIYDKPLFYYNPDNR